jgi:hypothetical protein
MKSGVTQERAEVELTALVNDSSIAAPGALGMEGARASNVRTVARAVGLQATPGSAVEGIRAEIRRAAPDLPIQSTVRLDEAVAASLAPPRFRMVLLGLFAMTAMLIATCGIYGLMAYAVTQRRREIGVRMALGADRRDVLRLVLSRAFRIVAAGLIVGLAGAAAVTRVLRRDADRSDRVHDRHAAADDGGTDGGMAARAPRDKGRPLRRAPRGIAVNEVISRPPRANPRSGESSWSMGSICDKCAARHRFRGASRCPTAHDISAPSNGRK